MVLINLFAQRRNGDADVANGLVNISWHALVACKVSIKKSTDCLMKVPS